jgi:cell division protein FtsZ
MVRTRTRGVAFIACNTDAQALSRSSAARRLRIGAEVTRGLGAGGDPAVGRRSAEEDADQIAEVLAGSELLFVTAGLGGGTGSGAAPIVARIAREQGALTIGVVTRPFAFEGVKRRLIADAAVDELRTAVDALIVIPNDRVRDVVEEQASILDAFAAVDDVLRQGVQGVIEIITKPGLVNLDFADVRAVLAGGGIALMGTGQAGGPDRAAIAAQGAIASPLLEADIAGARSILFNVSGGVSLSLAEVTAAAEAIRANADPDANVVFGASFDASLGDEVRVTVVATGLRGLSDRAAISDRSAGTVEPAKLAGAPLATERLPRPSSPEIAASTTIATAGVRSTEGTPIEATGVFSAGSRRRPSESRSVAALPEAAADRAEAADNPADPALAAPASAGSPSTSTGLLADDLEVPSFLRRKRTDR